MRTFFSLSTLLSSSFHWYLYKIVFDACLDKQWKSQQWDSSSAENNYKRYKILLRCSTQCFSSYCVNAPYCLIAFTVHRNTSAFVVVVVVFAASFFSLDNVKYISLAHFRWTNLCRTSWTGETKQQQMATNWELKAAHIHILTKHWRCARVYCDSTEMSFQPTAIATTTIQKRIELEKEMTTISLELCVYRKCSLCAMLLRLCAMFRTRLFRPCVIWFLSLLV